MALKSGVVVNLYKNGVFVETQTTDGSGAYSFTGLTPGTDYKIYMVPPTISGYTVAFKQVTISNPAGVQTSQPTSLGNSITVVAGANSTAAFQYNKTLV